MDSDYRAMRIKFEAEEGGRSYEGEMEVLAIHSMPGDDGREPTGKDRSDLDPDDIVTIVLNQLNSTPGFSWDLHEARYLQHHLLPCSDSNAFLGAFVVPDDLLVVVARVDIETWVFDDGLSVTACD